MGKDTDSDSEDIENFDKLEEDDEEDGVDFEDTSPQEDDEVH